MRQHSDSQLCLRRFAHYEIVEKIMSAKAKVTLKAVGIFVGYAAIGGIVIDQLPIAAPVVKLGALVVIVGLPIWVRNKFGEINGSLRGFPAGDGGAPGRPQDSKGAHLPVHQK